MKEQLFSIAREYARQFGELIEYGPEFWVADDPWFCSFGDAYFFTLEEMASVVDNLPELVKRYGSKEAVGQEIRDWVSWWLDSDIKPQDHERIEGRVTRQLRVNITLMAWLRGCPREEMQPFAGPDADYLRHLNEHDTLESLIAEYRENRSLGNVLASVDKKLDADREAKARRDFESWEKIVRKEIV